MWIWNQFYVLGRTKKQKINNFNNLLQNYLMIQFCNLFGQTLIFLEFLNIYILKNVKEKCINSLIKEAIEHFILKEHKVDQTLELLKTEKKFLI